jgi:hypothetical protein
VSQQQALIDCLPVDDDRQPLTGLIVVQTDLNPDGTRFRGQCEVIYLRDQVTFTPTIRGCVEAIFLRDYLSIRAEGVNE